MKTIFNISSIYFVAVHIYFSCFPAALLSEKKLTTIYADLYISSVDLAHCDEYLAEGNILKIAETSVLKFTNSGKLQFKPSLKPREFLFWKKYIQSNELYFNLPLISYKFPLSEHTEEG